MISKDILHPKQLSALNDEEGNVNSQKINDIAFSGISKSLQNFNYHESNSPIFNPKDGKEYTNKDNMRKFGQNLTTDSFSKDFRTGFLWEIDEKQNSSIWVPFNHRFVVPFQKGTNFKTSWTDFK